jgi:hypothetical protein
MKTASEDLKIPVPIDLMASRESLYAAVRGSSRNLSDIESRGNVPPLIPSLPQRKTHLGLKAIIFHKNFKS